MPRYFTIETPYFLALWTGELSLITDLDENLIAIRVWALYDTWNHVFNPFVL